MFLLLNATSIRLPALHHVLEGLHSVQLLDGGRLTISEHLRAHPVASADLDLVQFVQDVQLCQVERGDAADHQTLTQLLQVKPPAAAFTPGGHSKLLAFGLQVIAQRVLLFSGHGAIADTRELGFDHPDGLRECTLGDAQAIEDARHGGVAAGHERLGPVVHVQHHAVRPFSQDVLAVPDRIVELERRVNDRMVPQQLLALILELTQLLGHVVLDACVPRDYFVEVCLLCNEVIPVEDVSHSESAAHRLERICRSNAFGSSADGSIP